VVNPEWIQARRKVLGLSLEALARQAGMSTSYLNQVVRQADGRRLVATSEKGQKVLEVLAE
jgi:transcriptional regulator with XRE-family HTH domain